VSTVKHVTVSHLGCGYVCPQQVCRQFTSICPSQGTLELKSNIKINTHVISCGKEINNALKFCKRERWRRTKLSVRFDVLAAAILLHL
jgi:hypothetical protein